MKGKNTSRF